ncbi:MAG: DUF3347 domain-containing protein [Bacteroidia bacterium]
MKILSAVHPVLFASLLAFTACDNKGNQATDEHKNTEDSTHREEAKEDMAEDREDVFDAYNELKNALVKNDAEKAKKAVGDMKTELDKVKTDNLSAADITTWNAEAKKMREHLDKMQAAADVKEMRNHFKPLSDVLYANIKKYGLADETVYYQHCPMAFNNEGASWLSEDEEISNPYLPDEMLRCGFTQDTVAKE